MVSIKVDLGKRDFLWISFLVVLVGVGFVYATGSGNPAVMGHDIGEVSFDGVIATLKVGQICDAAGSNCFSPADISGTGGGLDLVNGYRSSAQCIAAGGTVVTVEGSNKVCKFSGTSCAAGGWTPYKSWSTTVFLDSATCTAKNTWPCPSYYDAVNDGVCGIVDYYGAFKSCSYSVHNKFSDISKEACSTGYVRNYTHPNKFWSTVSCEAKVTEVGCY